MKGDPQGRSHLSHSIHFMSMNVGRGDTTHDIALARACELELDFLLVQEPWWSGCTKSHPYFDRHTPYGGTNIRPREITYTRKDANINAEQFYPYNSFTGDYCWVIVNNITFLNVYKAPHNVSAVQPLISWNLPPKSVAVGDFNPVYWGWQPGAITTYGQDEEIEKWAEDNNLTCLIIGEPTHRAGNTLDLAWTNIDGTCAWVDRDECVTSDHLPIRGSMPCSIAKSTRDKQPLKVSKENLPQFGRLVS